MPAIWSLSRIYVSHRPFCLRYNRDCGLTAGEAPQKRDAGRALSRCAAGGRLAELCPLSGCPAVRLSGWQGDRGGPAVVKPVPPVCTPPSNSTHTARGLPQRPRLPAADGQLLPGGIHLRPRCTAHLNLRRAAGESLAAHHSTQQKASVAGRGMRGTLSWMPLHTLPPVLRTGACMMRDGTLSFAAPPSHCPVKGGLSRYGCVECHSISAGPSVSRAGCCNHPSAV